MSMRETQGMKIPANEFTVTLDPVAADFAVWRAGKARAVIENWVAQSTKL